MTAIPDTHSELLDAQIAHLSTIGPDGRPQSSLVWFYAENGEVSLSLNTVRQKTKNLLARPVCNLLIIDPSNPYRYLEIRGDVEIAPDPDYVFADKVGKKYNADLRVHDKPGESRVVVRILPSRVNAIDMGR
jgi:PPOX class probable F420-dependent enzyme